MFIFMIFPDCNVIPLPPKDPRAVQQLTASKPRHQRKYPLVMPNLGGSSSTCQSTIVNNELQRPFCDQIIACSKCGLVY